MSSALPNVSTTGATSWRKRAGAQTQQTHRSLGSWFLSTFAGVHKGTTKFLREHRDETMTCTTLTTTTTTITTTAIRRRPMGTLSAVTNQQQANAARREEMGTTSSQLRRQQSFLRQELLEMKQQSAKTLEIAQKRINGEQIDSEEEEDDEVEENKNEGRDRYHNYNHNKQGIIQESDNEDDDDDDESYGATGKGISTAAAAGEGDALRKSWGSDPARSQSPSSRRRSVAEEQQERNDALMAHEVQRDEYSKEADRRMSQATQLYAEAISALDFALRPGRKRHHSEPSQPLLLGVKRGSPNMPKSEWI